MNSIGSRIREIRELKNISIKELADKTNLSSSFISQLERDLVSPSIMSLREIAKALDLPIFYLIDEGASGEVVRKDTRRRFSMPGSDVTYQLLSPDLNRKMEIVLITLGPGESTFNKPYAHKGEESAYCMKGIVEITLGIEKKVLEPGDSIYFYCDTPHCFRNIGNEEAQIISSVTPPSF